MGSSARGVVCLGDFTHCPVSRRRILLRILLFRSVVETFYSGHPTGLKSPECPRTFLAIFGEGLGLEQAFLARLSSILAVMASTFGWQASNRWRTPHKAFLLLNLMFETLDPRAKSRRWQRGTDAGRLSRSQPMMAEVSTYVPDRPVIQT